MKPHRINLPKKVRAELEQEESARLRRQARRVIEKLKRLDIEEGSGTNGNGSLSRNADNADRPRKTRAGERKKSDGTNPES